MDVVAAVDISDGNFDEWFDFFKSYEPRRHEFVADEVITKVSDTKALVAFTIKDIDGLTELSSSQFLLDGEARLGITVELSEKLP
jgi:hypothetical protein|tara:strand:+ start:2894 stop:3148 length:255 start_codon:yes stop_codon:yes gene_type:complete